MLLVTAPSKTQKWLECRTRVASEPRFLGQSCQLVDILRHYDVESLCQLMKMGRALGESTFQRLRDFQPPLTPDNSRQALFTFQGDAYSSLTPEAYSEAQLLHAQRHIRILSGLYGILRPLDLMFPYRLEMGLKLAVGSATNLYQFWGEALTTAINDACHDHEDQTLVNLASQEYFKAIKPALLRPRLLTITFKQRQKDSYRTIPIHAKRARGLMLHYVITTMASRSEELRAFAFDGYRFNDQQSEADNWVFTREEPLSRQHQDRPETLKATSIRCWSPSVGEFRKERVDKAAAVTPPGTAPYGESGRASGWSSPTRYRTSSSP